MASVTSLGLHEPSGLPYAVAENILPPNPSPELYTWEIFADQNGEDELFTTETCVIWSRGGEVGRCLRFDIEKEAISKSLLAYFPISDDDTDTVDSSGHSGTAHGVGNGWNSTFNIKTKGKGRPVARRPALAKSLIVFLKTQARVYSFSAGEHVVHMPFEVESAIAAPVGVILQRKSKVDTTVPVTLKFPRVPPNSFVSSQILPVPNQTSTSQTFSTASLGKPKHLPLRFSSTLETMWDTPLETAGNSGWPRLVCITDPMMEIGLVVSQLERPAKDRNPKTIPGTPSFLDPAEEILHIESIPLDGHSEAGRDDLTLAVTVNRETSMYTIWRMTYANTGNRLMHRRQTPKTKGPRRRSSVQLGLASGATTPHYPSFRESVGAVLPMKKTRRSERLEKGKDKGKDKEGGPLEKVLSLEPGRAEVSRRQSRRASSLLARADLSASHDRPLFSEQPSTAATGVRRSDSHGSQRSRASSVYAGGGGNISYSQTLNSLLEAPVDGLLEELRSGGDFEGFHNMGLDDPEFDTLSTEIVFTKVHSLSMDTANIRYSLSSTLATKLCKVFIVVGTPYSVDEQDRNYLLVCIQDTVDKRLQLLTLHVQERRAGDRAVSITWGQHRKAQNVVDSCRIYDGDQSMILILSEGGGGQRQLSIQAPWSELTTVSLPPLSLHNRDLYAFDASDELFQRSGVILEPGTQIDSFRFPRDQGIVDIVDENGLVHQVQIQLEPRSTRVRCILDVLRSILPASYAEKIVMGWWRIMQWLGLQPDIADATSEWMALTTELCVMFLALLQSGESTQSTSLAAWSIHSNPVKEPSPDTGTNRALGPWSMSKAWRWASDEVDQVGALSSGPAGFGSKAPLRADTLSVATRLAKRFMASPAGEQAVGDSGYLPTALGLSEATRKSTAWGIVMALHLYLEEEKLDIMASTSMGTSTTDLKALVHQMAKWLQWPTFVERYALELDDRILPLEDTELELRSFPLPEPANVPSIYAWIGSRLAGQTSDLFPSLADVYSVVSQRNHNDLELSEKRWQNTTPRTQLFCRFFKESTPSASSVSVVEAMFKCGFTSSILDSLPEGISAPFQDAISRCQQHPPSYWGKELFELVGRGDINTVLKPNAQSLYGADSLHAAGHQNDDGGDDLHALEEPESEERQIIIQALFREDKRLYEAQSMLSSSTPRVVRLNHNPSWSESEYLERQKDLVTTIATATLATSAGRGMLNYGFRFPLLTQKFNVQGFNLTCIVKPSNVAVGVEKSLFTEDKVNWAFFHQGVAYGLAISARAKGIDTSWIVFNKPGTDLSHRHAGFLFALGLNGHLKSVAKWVAFKYLTPKHMMTSIGLLLGLAVSHLGTMDSLITRLLSVHVTRMLPRGAAELNLSHQIQTTGIMGIGLLYYNSQHRRMSEIMMSEIEYMGDEDEENPLRNEGYRLAAAYALGFINLGKGSDRKGLLDMQITEHLLSLASSTKKVELVNVLDRSAAAATIAIALIFMKTEDHIVARKVDIPDSVLQFDYARPDVLLLRTVAKNLILWSKIDATMDWLRQNLPTEYRHRADLRDVKALRSVDLPFFSIVAGLCFSSALRFSGTANQRVRDMIVYYLDRFIEIVQDFPVTNFDSQIARSGARVCLDVLALSCATVMAGTGDLVVLRRLRALHGRDDAHTTYGSHFAAHLAVGTLFLGSGTTTFGNSSLAVAALLVAFYPVFPVNIQDNGSHLQAFRHFWVLATEPRCLVTKDVSTGQPVSVPVLVQLKPTSLSLSNPSEGRSPEDTILRRETPCLLPPLEDIVAVRTDASAHGFWDLEIPFEREPSLRAAFQTNQNLYLRRRPAHESTFATTLQALSSRPSAPIDVAKVHLGGMDPLEWVFSLDSFRSLSRTERAHILGVGGVYEGSGVGGGSHSLSNAIDARLVLEGNLDEVGAGGRSLNKLYDLRLLFDWAEQRDDLRKDREENKASGGTVAENQGHAGQQPPSDELADWWMSDGAVDMLEGKVWFTGQE